MSAVLKLKKKDEIFYPETDGKPIAETDVHREQMNYLIRVLKFILNRLKTLIFQGT